LGKTGLVEWAMEYRNLSETRVKDFIHDRGCTVEDVPKFLEESIKGTITFNCSDWRL